MKILHITEHLLNVSGVAQVVTGLAAAEAELGHDVGILFGRIGGRVNISVPPKVTSHPCAFGLTRILPGLGPHVALAILEVVKRYEIIHIHGLWNFFTEMGMLSALVYHRPFLVAPHGALEPWALRQKGFKKKVFGRVIERPLLKRARLLHVLTSAEAEDCSRYCGHGRRIILPNGVDGAFLNHPSKLTLREFGIPEAKQVVLFLGRITPKKGLDILIRAWPSVVDKVPDAVLVIAGSDCGTGYLKEIRIRPEVHSDSGIVFVGEVWGEKKAALLSGASIFVLPSYSEGLPMSILEALAAGVPCVVSDACNLPEIAAVQAGIVVRPEVEAVRSSLITLLTSPTKRVEMGQRARCLAQAKFSWHSIAIRAVEAYRSALAKNLRAVENG